MESCQGTLTSGHHRVFELCNLACRSLRLARRTIFTPASALFCAPFFGSRDGRHPSPWRYGGGSCTQPH